MQHSLCILLITLVSITINGLSCPQMPEMQVVKRPSALQPPKELYYVKATYSNQSIQSFLCQTFVIFGNRVQYSEEAVEFKIGVNDFEQFLLYRNLAWILFYMCRSCGNDMHKIEYYIASLRVNVTLNVIQEQLVYWKEFINFTSNGSHDDFLVHESCFEEAIIVANSMAVEYPKNLKVEQIKVEELNSVFFWITFGVCVVLGTVVRLYNTFFLKDSRWF